MKSIKFAVFDIDGTLIRWQLYHALADALVRLGYIQTDVYQSVKDARMRWKNRAHQESFNDYERHLIEAFDKLITGLEINQFNEAVEAVFAEYKDQVYSYTRELVRQLKAKGYRLFAISGSQIEIVGKLASYYGFDDCVGSQYEQVGSHFSGQKTLTMGKKHLILKELVQKHDAIYKDSIGVGDTEGDVTMLEMVQRPIAFNPNKALFEQAKKKGWEVIVERKNVTYKLTSGDGKYFLA